MKLYSTLPVPIVGGLPASGAPIFVPKGGGGFFGTQPPVTKAPVPLLPPQQPSGAAAYENATPPAPASPQWSTGAVLNAVTATQTTGGSLKARVIIILGFLLLLAGAFGQSDNSIHVKEFTGLTVGDKVSNAMSVCPADGVPCILIVDASLAAWPAGTMPSLCANCYLADYRSGLPAAASKVLNGELYVDAFSSGVWGGTWTSGTAYSACTAVTAGGKYYVSGVQTEGDSPAASPSKWLQFFPAGSPASVVPTALDCAVAQAETSVVYPNVKTVILGNNAAGYDTCTGLVLSDPSDYTRGSVNLVGSAPSTASQIIQTCQVTHGTIYNPTVSGAYTAGTQHTVILRDLFVNANFNAPYAIELVGYEKNDLLENLRYRNGTTGDLLMGVDGNSDGWSFQSKFVNTSAEYSWSGGSGASVTCSLSGGVPSCTVGAGGSNYSSSTAGFLTGFQGGASNQPCSTMGTVSVTVSGGVVTAFTPSGFSGCSGSVYANVYDGPPIDYGDDLEYVTDSHMIDMEEVAGRVAGLKIKHGNDEIYSHHSYTNGEYGTYLAGNEKIFGENCGEQFGACWYITNNSSIDGAIYASSITWPGSALVNTNSVSNLINISDVTCTLTQGGEFHSFASPSGTADTSLQASGILAGVDATRVAYCGTGGGSSITWHPHNYNGDATIGSPTAGGILYLGYQGTNFWNLYMASATNGNARLCDVTNSLCRMELVQNGASYYNSGNGSNAVNINMNVNSGTEGLIVGSGGATPVKVAQIDGSGNVIAGNGTNVVYRCTVAGTLPVGALTTNSGQCGASGTADTGLRTK